MSTHPYIPLYVDDFEAATAHLTIEEDGVYSRLLRLCWRTPGCSIPNDPAWIARKIRLSADDFERVARPVIDEFFKAQRGRLVQKRLKDEYDDITRKKLARANAGKKGGAAKALKTGDVSSGNATDLPTHTGAFPEPKPEPKKEEDAKASLVFAEPKTEPPKPRSKPTVGPAEFEAAWAAYPHVEGRSSKPNALAEWKKLDLDIRSGLVAAIGRFIPKVSQAHGDRGAPDMARWLRDGKHLNWQGVDHAASAPPAVFDGPPEIRSWAAERLTEGYARSYIDPSGWDAGTRALLAANPFAEGRLKRDLAEICERWKFTVRQGEIVAPVPSSDLFQQGVA